MVSNVGTYIKDDDRILSPRNAGLTVLGMGEVVVEKTKQGVAFLPFETDDVRRICGELLLSPGSASATQAQIPPPPPEIKFTRMTYTEG